MIETKKLSCQGQGIGGGGWPGVRLLNSLEDMVLVDQWDTEPKMSNRQLELGAWRVGWS